MADQFASAEALAQPFIVQCRREIAAAWVHVEAAREMLGRGRWLMARWAERRRLDASEEAARLASSGRSEAARIGMFVGVEVAPRRRHHIVGAVIRRGAFRSPRRSASG